MISPRSFPSYRGHMNVRDVVASGTSAATDHAPRLSSVAPFPFRNGARTSRTAAGWNAASSSSAAVISEFLLVRSLPRHFVLCSARARVCVCVPEQDRRLALVCAAAARPESRARDAFPRSS